jgi:hypothetical protein
MSVSKLSDICTEKLRQSIFIDFTIVYQGLYDFVVALTFPFWLNELPPRLRFHVFNQDIEERILKKVEKEIDKSIYVEKYDDYLSDLMNNFHGILPNGTIFVYFKFQENNRTYEAYEPWPWYGYPGYQENERQGFYIPWNVYPLAQNGRRGFYYPWKALLNDKTLIWKSYKYPGDAKNRDKDEDEILKDDRKQKVMLKTKRHQKLKILRNGLV